MNNYAWDQTEQFVEAMVDEVEDRLKMAPSNRESALRALIERLEGMRGNVRAPRP